MTGPQGPQKDAGVSSPETRAPRYLAIGRIVRAHGIRGEVSVEVLTDFPERFDVTEWVYLGNEYEAEVYRLESYRWHKQHVLLKLAGVDDRTHAQQLRDLLVQVPIEEAMPLPEGDYYLFQLIGLQVITETGQQLGTIAEIIETRANDVYVVERIDNQPQILLPAIPDVVKRVDLQQGQMVVELMAGLI